MLELLKDSYQVCVRMFGILLRETAQRCSFDKFVCALLASYELLFGLCLDQEQVRIVMACFKIASCQTHLFEFMIDSLLLYFFAF
jgi:hypothetical protein